MSQSYRVGLIGGRGYTGMSLLPLIAAHPALSLAFATSSTEAGQSLRSIDPQWQNPNDVLIALEPTDVASVQADIWILALPNGASAPWVSAIDSKCPEALIVDLSADHRFEADAAGEPSGHHWVYGLVEHAKDRLVGAKRVANPGCYATAAQLGLKPVASNLDGSPVVFGVSGYSGAGKTPSPKNDPARLKDNLMPYQLTGHVHEREISHQLGTPVSFHPHVAPFFRGLSVTIHARLGQPMDADTLLALFQRAYAADPLVEVCAEIPEVQQVAGTPKAIIGGFGVDARDPHQAVWVVVLDNLLKGAATQAIQNINVALGMNESWGLGVSI